MKKLFEPNIGRDGRLLRAVIGLLLLAMAVWIDRIHWFGSAGLGLGSAFCLFQALRGWCLARACGIKTRW